jgi:hypothetical protein
MLSQGLDAEQGLIPPGSFPIRQEFIAAKRGPLSDYAVNVLMRGTPER